MIWNDKNIKKFTEIYPYKYAKEIALIMGLTVEQVYRISTRLKLKKDPEFRKMELQRQAERLKIVGVKARFPKGHKPANLGKKMSKDLYDKIKPTMFKKGQDVHNEKYDGYERITKDGYMEVRIRKGKFKLKHRLLYEEYHDITLLTSDVIIFVDRNNRNFNIGNLKKITREELMAMNTIHNYPTELKQVIKLNSKLKKKINEKQN
jgi:hypothetical protein